MADSFSELNPYQSTPESISEQQPPREPEQTRTGGLSRDCLENLILTIRIMRIASVLFGIGSVVAVVQVYFAYAAYGYPDEWTWWHTMIAYRLVYAPCWLLLAWLLWKYATALQRMVVNGIVEVEAAMEQQAKAWLAVALIFAVILIGMAIAFRQSLNQALN